MASRARNQIIPRENRGLQVQAKQNAVPVRRAPKRSALGEISNRQAADGPAQEKEKKNEVKESSREPPLPQIQVNDDVSMEEIQEETDVVRIFPEGVLDIDALEDQHNPQLCVEYAPSIYAYLRDVEEGLSIKRDYLNGQFVTGKMRGVLVDWLIEVHMQFNMLQETLYMTIYIIDKFLQVESFSIRKNKLQLVGVSAMFLASKVEEMFAPEINDFAYITDNSFTAADIRQMELRILNSLSFNFSRPLPLHFLRRNSKAGDVDVLQHTVAKYLIEMSLVEYDLVHLPPSLIAAAALFLSLRLLEPNATLANTWTPTLQHYSTYNAQQVLPVVCKLALAVTRRRESKFQAVHTKYKARKFMNVSTMGALKSEVVAKLAKNQLRNL